MGRVEASTPPRAGELHRAQPRAWSTWSCGQAARLARLARELGAGHRGSGCFHTGRTGVANPEVILLG